MKKEINLAAIFTIITLTSVGLVLIHLSGFSVSGGVIAIIGHNAILAPFVMFFGIRCFRAKTVGEYVASVLCSFPFLIVAMSFARILCELDDPANMLYWTMKIMIVIFFAFILLPTVYKFTWITLRQSPTNSEGEWQ